MFLLSKIQLISFLLLRVAGRKIRQLLLLHIIIIYCFKFRQMLDAVDATVLLFCHI
jgi:hypothetical protein